MSKVLLTGGSGFIGRHVVQDLLTAGYSVRVLDALIEQVHGSAAPTLPDEVEFIQGNVCDRAVVQGALIGVDKVIHLAAEVGVGQSQYEIARYVGANDLGTAVLLEAMIGRSIRKIVVASSMSVYGEGAYETESGQRITNARRRPEDIRSGDWNPRSLMGRALRPLPTDEQKPVDLASIYALTKFAQERQVLIFGEAYNVPAVALRLFNVFGAGQALSNPYTGVLANFAARLASGQPPTIFEDGQQKRDFVHVRDVARAFRLALEKDAANGQVINVGSGQAYSVSDIALLLAQAMGVSEIEPDILGKARSGDIRHCFADIGKAREILGFEPRHRLEDTLEELASWVRSEVVVDRGAEMRRGLEERGLVS
ncbi:NAD-dependent epimerase/dehydratase family protein [Pelagibacterium luteolum]|uniref:dTDP-L-rhamnose 4-epimerase n=1 Tax=Pelagibacterium luteolum TaxID=440168 RepID=A0A1G8A596_9HYPH|nr:NAD-dependent epimerase/dehydratase family protein [Pelagibacterium luteolum]SDH16108.1 dTDP-L-rhamnose 4-epimerase [Pelagibacterium luteolum]